MMPKKHGFFGNFFLQRSALRRKSKTYELPLILIKNIVIFHPTIFPGSIFINNIFLPVTRKFESLIGVKKRTLPKTPTLALTPKNIDDNFGFED